MVGQIELETFLTAGKDLKVKGPNKDTAESVIVLLCLRNLTLWNMIHQRI